MGLAVTDRDKTGGTGRAEVGPPARSAAKEKVDFQACPKNLPWLAQQLGEVAFKAGAIFAGKCCRPASASAGAAQLLFLVANKQLHVDGRFVVDAPAHADSGGIAPEHHARQANVLRHDHVARLQANLQKLTYRVEIE